MKDHEAKKYVIYKPAADVTEMENGWCIDLDVPGASNEMLEVNVEDNILKIKAETMLQEHGRPVKFERSFQLSDEVDAGAIKANLKDGMLQLALPKAEAAKPRKIQVLTA